MMPFPPLSVIAEWPPANYVDPVTRGSSLFIVNTVFTALAGLLVLFRVYTRVCVTHWFGWDDLFICLALVFSIGLTVGVDIGFSHYGWNRHIWDIPIELAKPSLILAFALRMVYLFAGACIHISFLCFYFRLTNESNIRWFRWLLFTSIFLAAATWITFLLLSIFQCTPVKAQWVYIENSHCMSNAPPLVTGSVIKVFFDVLITTLPIPLVARMRLGKKQKYGVLILFSLGYVVTAAGALRTYYTYLATTSKLDDTTWYQYPAFLAAAVENDLAIICACIPTLRPLVRPILASMRGSSVISRWRSVTSIFATTHRTVMESRVDTGEQPEGNWLTHPIWRGSNPQPVSVWTTQGTESVDKGNELPIMSNTSSHEQIQETDRSSRTGSAMSWYGRRRSDGLPLSFYGKAKDSKNNSEVIDNKESKSWVIHVKDELTVESSENIRVLPDPRTSEDRGKP